MSKIKIEKLQEMAPVPEIKNSPSSNEHTSEEESKKILISGEEAKKRSDDLELGHKNSLLVHSKHHENYVNMANELEKAMDEYPNRDPKVVKLKSNLLDASQLRYLALVDIYNSYVRYAEFTTNIRNQQISSYEQKLSPVDPELL